MNEDDDWHLTPILFKKGDKIIYDDSGCHIILADPNTCERCGTSNHNKPSVIIRQSGKGKLVCQACYDIINPEEKDTLVEKIEKSYFNKPLEDKNESISSSKTQKEERAVRNSPRRI